MFIYGTINFITKRIIRPTISYSYLGISIRRKARNGRNRRRISLHSNRNGIARHIAPGVLHLQLIDVFISSFDVAIITRAVFISRINFAIIITAATRYFESIYLIIQNICLHAPGQPTSNVSGIHNCRESGFRKSHIVAANRYRFTRLSTPIICSLKRIGICFSTDVAILDRAAQWRTRTILINSNAGRVFDIKIEYDLAFGRGHNACKRRDRRPYSKIMYNLFYVLSVVDIQSININVFMDQVRVLEHIHSARRSRHRTDQ